MVKKMTKKEALQILAILKAAYPASYNGMTKEEATGTVAVWCMQFEDMPAEIVMMAIHKLIATNKFPPSISEVKGKISRIHSEASEMLWSNLGEFLTPEQRNQYKRIYDLTSNYKIATMAEPPLSRLMFGPDGQPLQLGAGE